MTLAKHTVIAFLGAAMLLVAALVVMWPTEKTLDVSVLTKPPLPEISRGPAYFPGTPELVFRLEPQSVMQTPGGISIANMSGDTIYIGISTAKSK